MAYVNIYQYDQDISVDIKKTITSGASTYVIGRITYRNDPVPHQMFIGKLDADGNFIWQRRYIYPDTGNYGGSTWNRIHFTDVVELSNSKDIFLLGYDRDTVLILRINENGTVIWARKIYDVRDVKPIYNYLSFKAQLLSWDNNSLAICIQETHSLEGVMQIDYKVYKIDIGGNTVQNILISTRSPIFVAREIQMENGLLTMHGGFGEFSGVVQINKNLAIVKAQGLSYNGSMNGFNSFHVYAISPLYQNRIFVLGSFYHIDTNQLSSEKNLEWTLDKDTGDILEQPKGADEDLSNRYTRFFVAELSADYNQINAIGLSDKDFMSVKQTTGLNNAGRFFSISTNLFKINTTLSQTDWKKIIKDDNENINLLVSEQYNNKITSYASRINGMGIAQTSTEYESCRTQSLNDPIRFSPLQADWIPIKINSSLMKITPYPNPQIRFLDVSLKNQQNICGNNGGGDTGVIKIDVNTKLQSADLYLQAAGSTGNDSTAGIHLRWMLKNNLQDHLPKGDFYQESPQGNNKPDDYIQIYRTSYQPVVSRFSFRTAPQTIVDNERLWLYRINDKDIHVYFRNISQYNQVRSTINPLNDPIGFLEAYGENLIEVESRNHLFFGVQLHISETGENASVKTELCSVETEQINLPKNVTFREELEGTALQKVIYTENGRSIRFVPINSIVFDIQFQFYIDFILTANKIGSWSNLGRYSLSTQDDEVYKRLDPDSGAHPIHGKWLRYNDEEYVNVENYVVKWNGDLEDPRERIKDSVERYLNLSNDSSNPLANETYYLNDEPDSDNELEISHLMILQMAALDYHVARMLGLGLLDLENSIYSGDQFIYAAEYFTIDQNGNEQGQKNHIFLSMPTSLDDQRLPIPIDLKEPQLGIVNSEIEVEGSTPITDADGYAHDGKARYISLFAEELQPDEPADSPFYFSQQSFNMSKFTYPVYVGIEYKRAEESTWQKPELPNDPKYKNVTASGGISKNETIAIGVPEVGQPAYIHRETRSGKHTYGSYGVNWFGRGRSSNIKWDLETKIVPSNDLLSPSAINALLIQEESPLFLTSSKEQEMLRDISNTDKTFIRLLFEYDAAQDMIAYHKAIDGVDLPDFYPFPDNEEIFADEIEIFFSPDVPEQLFGITGNVSDDPNNPLISIIQSEPMPLPTADEPLYPTVASGDIPFYIGGILQVGTDQFIIHHIEIPSNNPLLPVFHVLKKQVGNAFGETHDVPFDPADFISPPEEASFMFTRNMLNEVSWGNVNPNPLKVKIGNNWPIHHEEVIITSGEGNDITKNTYFRKFRGVVRTDATVKKYTDSYSPTFSGLYEITLPGFSIGNHPQHSGVVGQVSVQWYRGSIRVPYQNDPEKEQKTLKVLRFHQENQNLIIYAQDENFETDPLQSGTSRNNIRVNFYPGYRVYLYHDSASRLTASHILPQEEGVLEKYSVFGLRSRVSENNDYISKISAPTMMFARKMESPKTPNQPKGALYATRPDYFGRSTYTFTTEYNHEPYSVSVGRSNDDILLTSLYKQTPYGEEPILDSVEDIQHKNEDDFANDRLLDLANAKTENDLFPIHNGYRFPLPNNPNFFESINAFIDSHNNHYGDSVPHISPGSISDMGDIVIPEVLNRNKKLTFYDFVKQTIFNTYVPLTEMPMIYQYVKGGDYMPLPKVQCIRDRNGALLKPTDEDFDIAPMMKKLSGSNHKTLFTDFTLDGASTSVYFYAVRETNAQMKQGNWSDAIGPIRLVNSYAVKTPEIKSVIPVLENSVLGISPQIQIETNSYESIYNIARIKLYRALNMGDATSVRAMTLVETLDLEATGALEEPLWIITDNFSDLNEIPFGDPLYYRVVVEAKIEYAEPNYNYDDDNPINEFTIVSDFAPSEPSKLMITAITENVQPSNPELTYSTTGDTPVALGNVTLKWHKQAYKAKYHLFKMNSNGNWEKIFSLQSNDENISVALSTTELGSGQLIIKDDDGNSIYHHFKVITENTAGMSGTEEKILTIP